MGDAALRQRVELRAEAHLRDRVEPARHQHFAAELAREIGLALEQRHAAPRAREQIAERCARGARTNDREVHALLRCASWYVREITSPEDEPCRSIRWR